MSEELFRKKNLDKIRSPENLNDYVRVSSPGVWLLLVSIIILLAGACVWGIFGHIDSTAAVAVQVENGSVTCVIGENNISQAKVGMTVKYAETEGTILSIGEKTGNGYVCTVEADGEAADGIYAGRLVLQRIQPASLVFD